MILLRQQRLRLELSIGTWLLLKKNIILPNLRQMSSYIIVSQGHIKFLGSLPLFSIV